MRFHVINLPHTQTTKDYCWCAYTSKVFRFCNMMTSFGHEVFLYGGTENDAKVTEFVSVVSDENYAKWFGQCNWDEKVFDQWQGNEDCWRVMNAEVISAIQERKRPGDILGITVGVCQKPIRDFHNDMRAVEWGVGYEGIIQDTFHVFESNPWMHYVYGQRGIADGRFFDAVIPNSFDEEDYIFKDKKDDYLLYLGRQIPRKGMVVIEQLAKRGHKIVMAGQKGEQIKGVEHIGVVRGKEKAELLANAKALLVPSLYIEPFGGVAIEAMLSGTPVITTDFGAFVETVKHGETGYRCHTMQEFDCAAKWAPNLRPKDIRWYAERFTTAEVRHKYNDYFNRLGTLDQGGWYA